MKLHQRIFGALKNNINIQSGKDSDVNTKAQMIVIIHGLFGQARNWFTVAQKLNHQTNLPVHCLDLRNHGHSPKADAFTFDRIRDDIRDTLGGLSLDTVNVIGHSLGGRVILDCLRNGFGFKSACIVDIGLRPLNNTTAIKYIDAMARVEREQLTGRPEIEARLMELGVPDQAMARFLMTNLVKEADGHFTFKLLYLDALRKQLLKPDKIEPFNRVLDSMPCLLVKGTRSEYVNAEDIQDYKRIFPKLEICELDAGHNVHADQPDLFVEAYSQFVLSSV